MKDLLKRIFKPQLLILGVVVAFGLLLTYSVGNIFIEGVQKSKASTTEASSLTTLCSSWDKGTQRTGKLVYYTFNSYQDCVRVKNDPYNENLARQYVGAMCGANNTRATCQDRGSCTTASYQGYSCELTTSIPSCSVAQYDCETTTGWSGPVAINCGGCFVPSNTPTPSKTNTPTPSKTNTPTPTKTGTPTPTTTLTMTPTNTPTGTLTITPSITQTPTQTPSVTQTPTPTQTTTPTPTNIPGSPVCDYLNVSPTNSGNVPLNLQFYGQGHGQGGNYITQMRIDFGDGNISITNPNSSTGSISAGHTYSQSGSFTATLTVTDNTGLTGGANNCRVVINPTTISIAPPPEQPKSGVETNLTVGLILSLLSGIILKLAFSY